MAGFDITVDKDLLPGLLIDTILMEIGEVAPKTPTLP